MDIDAQEQKKSECKYPQTLQKRREMQQATREEQPSWAILKMNMLI